MSNLQLGVVLKQDQKYDEARRYFERALLVRAGDPGVRDLIQDEVGKQTPGDEFRLDFGQGPVLYEPDTDEQAHVLDEPVIAPSTLGAPVMTIALAVG